MFKLNQKTKKLNRAVLHVQRYLIKNWPAFLIILAFVFLILNTLIFYPGYMSPDTSTQLHQALHPSSLNDWHPAIMALVWRALIILSGHHIASMLIFQLILLWSSLLAIALYIYHNTRSRAYSFLVLAIGLLPFVINISGVIWKDCQMAFSLLAAFALIFIGKKISGSRRYAILFIALLFIIYASALRYNAIPAIIPLLVWLATATNKKIFKYGIILFGLTAVVAVTPIVNYLFTVKHTNPSSSIMLDDVVHMYPVSTVRTDHSISPKMKRSLVSMEMRCNPKYGLTDYYWNCASPKQEAAIKGELYGELKELWIKGISHHPLRYAKFRIAAYQKFIEPGSIELAYIWQNGIDPGNGNGITYKYNLLSRITMGYVHFFSFDFGVIFRPYFWLLIGLATIVISWLKRKVWPHAYLILILSLSSTLYILSYLPLAIAADYRYIYWSSLASTLSLLFCLIDARNVKYKQKGTKI